MLTWQSTITSRLRRAFRGRPRSGTAPAARRTAPSGRRTARASRPWPPPPPCRWPASPSRDRGLPRSSMPTRCGPAWRRRSGTRRCRIAYLRFDSSTVVTGQPLARLRPQRLQRVHRRAVGLQATTRRPGAPIAAPVASGRPQPMAPPVELQPVVRRGGVGPGEEAAAEGDASSATTARSGSSAASVARPDPRASGSPRAGSGRGPGSGIAARGAPSSSASASSASAASWSGRASTWISAVRRDRRARLARIGEEADRLPWRRTG